DYAFLFDRPFMYVKADFDALPYDAYDIEEELWTFRVLEEIGIELKPESFSSIKQILLDASGNELLTENRAKAKDTAWQYRGKSGERVVEYLLEKQKGLV
ncbi:MAG TPA: CDP-glycerol--glycerophosphate glycerophosphotransferase, partial [Sphaerochaeta sp.]|nr:CDP-glycerol--glycerophosphate glycerophosphotransferase [Sphaerochaeta sp.]